MTLLERVLGIIKRSIDKSKEGTAMKKIGNVSEDEKNVISCLFEKKAALENLLKIIDRSEFSDMYRKLEDDYEKICTKYEQWWADTSEKYNWENCIGGYWSIDFETRDILLYKLGNDKLTI